MSFTDQKPRVATASDVAAKWGGESAGERFRCHLCGHKFVEGDAWRWVYANRSFTDAVTGKAWGLPNFLTCVKCDGADVGDRWLAHVVDAHQRFWWMT